MGGMVTIDIVVVDEAFRKEIILRYLSDNLEGSTGLGESLIHSDKTHVSALRISAVLKNEGGLHRLP